MHYIKTLYQNKDNAFILMIFTFFLHIFFKHLRSYACHIRDPGLHTHVQVIQTMISIYERESCCSGTVSQVQMIMHDSL